MGYKALKASVQSLFELELMPFLASEHASARDTLAVKIRDGRERWSGTRLRHCFYPHGGSCTEHTDYGLVTLQHCTRSGLEGFVDGEWLGTKVFQILIPMLMEETLRRKRNWGPFQPWMPFNMGSSKKHGGHVKHGYDF